MEFLETDFKKQRIPKRRINYRDNNNLLIGLNLKKYDKFDKKIRKHISNGLYQNKIISISKGQYKTTLNNTALDLIKKQINSIQDETISLIIRSISEEIESKAVIFKKDPLEGLNDCELYSAKIIKDNLVTPISQNIYSYIESQATQDIESVFSLEENLTEILFEHIREQISSVFHSLIIENQINIHDELNDYFDLGTVKSSIMTFIEEFSVDDMFFELQRLHNNIRIKDKTSVYLYMGEVEYKNNKYPIFYLPIELKKDQSKFDILFDSTVYVNRKALFFIVERLNEETKKIGGIDSLNERILHISEYNDSADFLMHYKKSLMILLIILNCQRIYHLLLKGKIQRDYS